MGRLNRRIYSKRRKRSSAFKLRFKNPESMSSQLINQLGQAQSSGTLAQQQMPTSGLASLAGRSGGLLGMMGSAGRATYQRDKEMQEMSNFYANQNGSTIESGGNEGGQDFSANGLNIKITKI
tara:strand:- start:22 stop:390 length:369 start_codon:yes stop_codon:yes gene_type:complete